MSEGERAQGGHEVLGGQSVTAGLGEDISNVGKQVQLLVAG